MLNTKLVNCTIADGNGGATYVADIGIIGDKIESIGDLSSVKSERTIDTTGKIVTPGFVDLHTHSDTFVLMDGRAMTTLKNGVTSELVGQCGFSIAPYLNDRMKSCPIPLGGPINWDTYGSYLDHLSKNDITINIGGLVGHAALRFNCMENPTAKATPEELDAMATLLDESLQQGAKGMSFGLEYEPGFSAPLSEMEKLCEIVARHDGLVAAHIRDRANYFDVGLSEAIALSRNTGARMQISHINPKYGRPDYAMKQILNTVLNARSEGVRVFMDVMPVNCNHSGATQLLPTWAHEGGNEKLLERLADPEQRIAMKADLKSVWQIVIDGVWDKIWLVGSSVHSDLIGTSIATIAKKRGTDELETLFDIMLEAGDSIDTIILASESFFFEDVDVALQDPECAIICDSFASAKDGPLAQAPVSPHTYDWTSEFFARFVEERKVMSFEEGIRRLTSVPARLAGFKKRGLITEGNFADIVIMDREKFKPTCTLKDMRVYPGGIEFLLINGQLVLENGEFTGNYPGKVLHHTNQEKREIEVAV